MSVTNDPRSPNQDGFASIEPSILLEGAATDPSVPQPRGDVVRAWLRTGTGIFTSLITVLAASLTVIFLLVPSLKPGPPVDEFGATLSDARIETGVTVDAYYARIGRAIPAELTATDLVKSGIVVSFTVSIEGFAGRTCTVRWSVFDSATNQRSSADWLVDQPGWPSRDFTPEGKRDQGNGEIFVQEPAVPGNYFVRVELIDPDGTRLSTIDSPVFSVAGSPGVPPPGALSTEASA